MREDRYDRPNAVPWPPIILVGAAVTAFVAGTVLPLRLDVPPALGWIAGAAALALDGWAMATMARAHTNILPHRAAGRLVTTGPFALTRNPIYVGNALLLAGVGLAVGSAWFLLAAAAAAVATHHLAVLREERHLAARFGADWEAYARRTPRWIGRSKRKDPKP